MRVLFVRTSGLRAYSWYSFRGRRAGALVLVLRLVLAGERDSRGRKGGGMDAEGVSQGASLGPRILGARRLAAVAAENRCSLGVSRRRRSVRRRRKGVFSQSRTGVPFLSVHSEVEHADARTDHQGGFLRESPEGAESAPLHPRISVRPGFSARYASLNRNIGGDVCASSKSTGLKLLLFRGIKESDMNMDSFLCMLLHFETEVIVWRRRNR